MKGMVKSLGNFWGDIFSLILATIGSILAVIIWYRLNKVFIRFSRLPIGIASGFIGGLIGFVLGILLEGNIESLVKKIRQGMA